LGTVWNGCLELMDAAAASKLLAGTDLFGSLPEDGLRELGERATRRSFAPGQLIFREGDDAESLYVVIDGLVKVTVGNAEGMELILTTLRSGDAFGELPLIDDGPRSASAIALSETTLLVLNRANLLDVLRRRPQLVDGLFRSIGAVVRRLTEQAADLVFLDLHGRVAKLLLRLADRGAKRNGAIVLDVHVTQTDLAEMVGGSRQSVNSSLHALERRGILEIHGREILIRDVEALRRRANM
jgi:CRP/FNR family transcriptional regulator, cyclic AMP receptor protein